MAKDNVVGTLIDQAYSLKREKEELYEVIAANRNSLRNLARTGVLGDSEAAEVDELYPPRKRRETAEEAAA